MTCNPHFPSWGLEFLLDVILEAILINWYGTMKGVIYVDEYTYINNKNISLIIMKYRIYNIKFR